MSSKKKPSTRTQLNRIRAIREELSIRQVVADELEHELDLSKPQGVIPTCVPHCVACRLLRDNWDISKRVQEMESTVLSLL